MLVNMTANDLDLLRQFARDHSQAAFTVLVNRHVNLVYSAALRQVRSPQLAEEIAQSVFSDLARAAGRLNEATGGAPVLTAWLYQVTRRTAIDAIRKESRRRLREQIAVEMTNMNATANDWTHIEPLLDDAMAALDETDRSAILLRYFENKRLREVGEALGTNDDAAQKRVSRAVERLREFFSKRNVTIGAGGLAVLISANAVQSAPVGLAATISAAAVLTGTAVHTSAVITATKAIAMTTISKTLITVTLAVVASAGIYEAHHAAQLREQNQTLQQQQAPLAEKIRQLQRERDDATNRLESLMDELAKTKSNNLELLKLRGEVTWLRNQASSSPRINSAVSANPSLISKLEKATLLKLRLDQSPDKKIPELQLLTEGDWLNASTSNLQTEDDYRSAFAGLRYQAKMKLVSMLQAALGGFARAHEGFLPGTVAELKPFFTSPVDDAVLDRYTMAQSGFLQDVPEEQRSNRLISEKAGVDNDFDVLFTVGANGYSTTGTSPFFATEAPNAVKAYKEAHNGQKPSQPSDLAPYFTHPIAPDLLERVFNLDQSN
jgi:RNA polymerase sigma factor (sigma-70 family)